MLKSAIQRRSDADRYKRASAESERDSRGRFGDNRQSSRRQNMQALIIKHQAAPTPSKLQEQGKPEQVPLGSFRVGDAILELGGFVDLENIFRTTNTQSKHCHQSRQLPIQQHATRTRHRISAPPRSSPAPELQDPRPFCRQRYSGLRGGRLQRQRCPQCISKRESPQPIGLRPLLHGPKAR